MKTKYIFQVFQFRRFIEMIPAMQFIAAKYSTPLPTPAGLASFFFINTHVPNMNTLILISLSMQSECILPRILSFLSIIFSLKFHSTATPSATPSAHSTGKQRATGWPMVAIPNNTNFTPLECNISCLLVFMELERISNYAIHLSAHATYNHTRSATIIDLLNRIVVHKQRRMCEPHSRACVRAHLCLFGTPRSVRPFWIVEWLSLVFKHFSTSSTTAQTVSFPLPRACDADDVNKILSAPHPVGSVFNLFVSHNRDTSISHSIQTI